MPGLSYNKYYVFICFLESNIITSSQYREIARKEPFRNMWVLSKTNIYTNDPCEWTADQKSLLIYSKMYDNVYDHPEKPDDKVIEDDDMLDGWLAKIRKENQQERKQKEANKLYDRGDGRGDLFVMTNQENAKDIANLNDIHGQIRMKQRSKAIKERGRLEPHQLPDVKLELQQEGMRMMAERFK